MTTGQNQCVECGKPASRRMICAKCMPAYEDRFTDDVQPSDPSRAPDGGEGGNG